MGDRPFDLSCHSEINTRQLLIWLSFVGIHVSLLSFALLTYPQVEEDRLLNLEASARGINKNSWSIFEIWPTSHLDGYDKPKLMAELHIKFHY